MPDTIFDIAIVGGGPSGMSAALYALRGGKKVLILEKDNFGGQIANSPRVENIPSIIEISGEEYASNLFDQITNLGVEFELEDVSKITKENELFKIETNYETHYAKSVILATGVKHRHIGVAREEELTGKGISYCAVCDGAFYKGKDVVVIGDANTALQYTILLSNYCKNVVICTLFDKFFADNILVERIKTKENISYFHNLSLVEFLGKEELSGLKFKDTKTNEEKTFNCDGVFIAIGQVPDNDKYANLVELEKGFIKVNQNMETKTPGLFASGDCTVKSVRQVVTACNDGAIAATMALRYLDN